MSMTALRALLCGAALLLLGAAGACSADWAASDDPLSVRPAPEDGMRSAMNPPGFSWSRHAAASSGYELEIRDEAGRVSTVQVASNWYLPPQPMAPGSYAWRVRPIASQDWSQDWSSSRSFSIGNDARVFTVPDNAALKSRVAMRARPRSLPVEGLGLDKWAEKVRSERGKALSRLETEVSEQMAALPAVEDDDWPLSTSSDLDDAKARQLTDVRQKVNAVARQLEASSLLFLATRERKYMDEAITRGDQLAGLNPAGPTSFSNQDQATRQIALSLMKATDLLDEDLPQQIRMRWLKIVSDRAEQLFSDLSQYSGRLDQHPLDSHGDTNLGYLAVISALGLGEMPRAEAWFDFAVRAYAHHVSPWGGDDGGFANGSAYAQYTAGDGPEIWQPLAYATGINLYAKPWSLGFLHFFTQFVPPGSTRHAFGDEAETLPDFRTLRAYASRIATPLAAWYVGELDREEDELSFLQAPFPFPFTTSPQALAPANSAFFPSIGWVAMHSDIASRHRTSVFFKSSRYGSFNHSHGDQNSFTLSKNNKPLLIDSGWYDWYGSPLSKTWYRQTRAHNAITYDGGMGQVIDGQEAQLRARGSVTAFSASPGVDYAEANATPAYGGALTLALRRIWYLRNEDAVIVWDKLTSDTPRMFEWNMHAPSAIVAQADGNVTINNDGATLCIVPLSSGLAFQRRQAPDTGRRLYEDHAFFATANAEKAAEFLFLLDVGCKHPAVAMNATANGKSLLIGSETVTISN